MLIYDRKTWCRFCGRVAFKSLQPRGEWFFHENKIMCVPCRVTKLSKKSAEIRGTKQNRTKDEIEKKKVVDEKEKKRIWAIAEESQRATKTKKYADS